MKVYSDILTKQDLTARTPPGVYVDEVLTIGKPRVRRYGWMVKLASASSNKHRNTGQYGAGEAGAASWDEHGLWMAKLYAKDPNAVIAHYNNAESFLAMTEGKYPLVSQASGM